ncbi:putative uncharacterized protein C8orf44 [Plecturocebus cupreus]
MVAHSCGPSYSGRLRQENCLNPGGGGYTLWEAKEGRPPEVRRSKPAWPIWRNPISTKNTKISWVWWQVPVIPATREAEAKDSLEPGQQGYLAPRHIKVSLGWAWWLITEIPALQEAEVGRSLEATTHLRFPQWDVVSIPLHSPPGAGSPSSSM